MTLTEMVNVAIETQHNEHYARQHFSPHIAAEISTLVCLSA